MPKKRRGQRSRDEEALILKINRRLTKAHTHYRHPHLKVKKLRTTEYNCFDHMASDAEFLLVEVSTGKEIARTYVLREWEEITKKFVRHWKLKSTTIRKRKSPFSKANSPNHGREGDD